MNRQSTLILLVVLPPLVILIVTLLLQSKRHVITRQNDADYRLVHWAGPTNSISVQTPYYTYAATSSICVTGFTDAKPDTAYSVALCLSNASPTWAMTVTMPCTNISPYRVLLAGETAVIEFVCLPNTNMASVMVFEAPPAK